MTKLLFIIVLAGLSGCAMAKKPAQHQYENSVIVNKSQSAAMSEVLAALATNSFSIKLSDKDSGVISAEKQIQRWNDKDIFDCSIYPEGAPLNSAAGLASVSVIVKKISETQSKVTINMNGSVLEPVLNIGWAASGASNTNTKCYSKGILEKKIFDELK